MKSFTKIIYSEILLFFLSSLSTCAVTFHMQHPYGPLCTLFRGPCPAGQALLLIILLRC